jgi:hypothetical protein
LSSVLESRISAVEAAASDEASHATSGENARRSATNMSGGTSAPSTAQAARRLSSVSRRPSQSRAIR